MRGVTVALLATAIAAAPLAAQKTSSGHSTGKRQWTAFDTHQKQALAMARKLEDAKSLSSATRKRDVVALGKHLDGADAELEQMDKAGTDKETVAAVQAHQKEARTHYDELLKVQTDPAGVSGHARAVAEHLNAAVAAHTPRSAAHEGGAKEKGKG